MNQELGDARREIKRLKEELEADRCVFVFVFVFVFHIRLQPQYLTIVEAAEGSGDVVPVLAGQPAPPATAGKPAGKPAPNADQKEAEEEVLGEQGKHRCDKSSRCKKSFATLAGLERHRKKHEGLVPMYTCNICGKPFARLKHLKAHKKTHEAKPLFKCQFCDKDLPSQYLLCNHTKKYHRPELGVCGNCGKECGSKANMREHKKHCKKAMKRAEKMGEGEEGGRNEFDPLEMRQQI